MTFPSKVGLSPIVATSQKVVRATFLGFRQSIQFADFREFPISKANEAVEHSFRPQRISDGILEVVGFHSLLHLGRVQVGLNEAVKIAQGRKLEFNFIERVPFQIDGEPAWLEPGRVVVEWK